MAILWTRRRQPRVCKEVQTQKIVAKIREILSKNNPNRIRNGKEHLMMSLFRVKNKIKRMIWDC